MFHDQNVDIAVIIEISERAPSARVGGGDTRAGFLDQLFEASVAQIAKHQSAACGNGYSGQRTLHFRVDASSHDKHIGKAIVVQIDHPSAPTDVPSLDAQPGADGESMKLPLPSLRI